MNRMRPQRGFTLTELMIIIAIIGILLGIATVSITTYQRRVFAKEAARTIDGDMSEIRTAARVRQQAVLVAFTSSGYTACIDTDASATCTAADTPILSRTFGGQAQIQGASGLIIPGGTITYTNLGTIDATRQIIASMATYPSRQYRVTIFSTGATRVEMSEDSGGTWTRAW